MNDLYKLAIGSAILGSGGGGNPFLGYKLLKAKMLGECSHAVILFDIE
ncbi:MAG: DUF917 family protein [Sulfolobaceae archaeon]